MNMKHKSLMLFKGYSNDKYHQYLSSNFQMVIKLDMKLRSRFL